MKNKNKPGFQRRPAIPRAQRTVDRKKETSKRECRKPITEENNTHKPGAGCYDEFKLHEEKE